MSFRIHATSLRHKVPSSFDIEWRHDTTTANVCAETEDFIEGALANQKMLSGGPTDDARRPTTLKVEWNGGDFGVTGDADGFTVGESEAGDGLVNVVSIRSLYIRVDSGQL